ncbi:hypothetical protein EPA93_15505 [Ktedonosporobacter rubrisoli]|uniref:Uncharacterized protein n=1 Tax=Ktedonosporobacter rubrisoli TaxID=2509675 RepID=A0A4P6JQ72_KTERU|nr:hypothetical protein [Ktedonosporobacter rubrisoli]QBD77320.1 hypothetical protein EPA93_15505 [Ktedonosporobacter rubrisoli]
MSGASELQWQQDKPWDLFGSDIACDEFPPDTRGVRVNAARLDNRRDGVQALLKEWSRVATVVSTRTDPRTTTPRIAPRRPVARRSCYRAEAKHCSSALLVAGRSAMS